MCASVWNGDEETHRRPAAGAKSQKQARMLCTRPMRVNQIQRETSRKRSITNRKSSFFFFASVWLCDIPAASDFW